MEITAEMHLLILRGGIDPKQGRGEWGAGLAGAVRRPNLDPHGVTQ